MFGAWRFHRINNHLHGTIVDYTHNHGYDRRIWSSALCEPRDMYVYLPPGYDPRRCYPLMLWLHGFIQDEKTFASTFVKPFDQAIACGQLPPFIIAAPDGTIKGRISPFAPNSFYINSKAGNFEDYILLDVWKFLVENYPIRPEREAHILAGMSMGGFAAYNLAFKYPEIFRVAVGVAPPLNLRWVNCRGRYMANFDPCCWGWRTDANRGREVLGRFFLVVTIRLRQLVYPLFDRKSPDTVEQLSRENPIEMLDHFDVRPGQFDLYIIYGGKDQFNIDAQVESFLYRARERGLCVGVGYNPRGRHDVASDLRLFPGMIDWLGTLLAPFAQPCGD